jgi:cellulose synthase/poly-beta-1,6-N-acetylglucosamine synthase-like glycosyltransferase
MLDILLIPLAIVYLLTVGALFVYGVNFFYMIVLSWRWRPDDEAAVEMDEWPSVTVQLPIYNELYVAERAINAVARLDYPADKLQIQVLDDSTDETAVIAKTAVFRHRTAGINIQHLHRTNREGFKAGALQNGLTQASGDYIAMFDADFVPKPDFLYRTLPRFRPQDAFVQARWGHLNRNYSLITRLQGLAIDAHFMVEQVGRFAGGYWFNFNGTAGIWRRAALDDAGGWQADTLTEDLDLSYRALLRGWRARYLRETVVPAELPVSMNAFRRQQHRWARGSLECALKLGPQVWQADLPLLKKVEASLHLTGYVVHLLLFVLSILYPVVIIFSQRYSQLITLFGIAYLFNFTALAPTCFFIAGQRAQDRVWWQRLPTILFVTVVGSGLMINTARAAWQIITKQQNVFERTAKFGIEKEQQGWMRKKYQLKLDKIVFWEVGFGMWNLTTVVYALFLGNWAIAFYAGIFVLGLLFVSGVTIGQTVSVWRQQKRPLPTTPTPASAAVVPIPIPTHNNQTDQSRQRPPRSPSLPLPTVSADRFGTD